MAGPPQARCVDSTRSVAVRVVVAVAHGALGHLAPVAAAVLVARTHHARALAQHVVLAVTGAGLHAKGPGLRPQARGWRCTWAATAWPVRGRAGRHAAKAARWRRRRLGLRIGAGLGLALALRRPSWVRAAQLVPPGLEPQRCPPRATPRQASSHGCHRGRRLHRGGGGATGAGGTTAGLASAGAAGLTWAAGGCTLADGAAGLVPSNHQASPATTAIPRPSAAYLAAVPRVSGAAGSGGKGQGAGAGALDGGAEGADASGARDQERLGRRGLAQLQGRHGCGC